VRVFCLEKTPAEEKHAVTDNMVRRYGQGKLRKNVAGSVGVPTNGGGGKGKRLAKGRRN